ncbi:centrosomal protein CEP57L1 isoform X4 [Pseudorasbora parva]|uniref:centrosomal protein CEP57L1 isoform X4 n=1 Tax=Pseudorasbora parva TaxID=51549 RepID=UPI00351E4A9A
MDHLGEKSLNLDSPSKQSYVGSYYQPPETLSRPLYMNTVSGPLDRKSSGPISPQLYQRVPDAGSRAVIAALKTLQEKMRRLELERVQAARNIQQFSHTAKTQADASAQREPENGTRDNHSIQRKELASKLHSAEKRCSLLEKQLDYMRKMVECAEKDRITHTGRQDTLSKESKHADPHMQAQLNKLEKLENEYLKLTSTQSMAESTSPSHSVNANVQSVLHMMKHRNPQLCERVSALQKSGSENQRVHRSPPSSPSKAASTMGSLSELLLSLQDELGQMSFEHQELVKQIDETNKRELRDDLERELDCLVRRMEEKAAQISKLRKHQQTVQKLSQPSCSPKQKQQKSHWSTSVDGKTRVQSGVQRLQPSPVKASPSMGQIQSRSGQESLKLLRETQKLYSSLRRQDITWET